MVYFVGHRHHLPLVPEGGNTVEKLDFLLLHILDFCDISGKITKISLINQKYGLIYLPVESILSIFFTRITVNFTNIS